MRRPQAGSLEMLEKFWIVAVPAHWAASAPPTMVLVKKCGPALRKAMPAPDGALLETMETWMKRAVEPTVRETPPPATVATLLAMVLLETTIDDAATMPAPE